jgi:predicted dehydrogenase
MTRGAPSAPRGAESGVCRYAGSRRRTSPIGIGLVGAGFMAKAHTLGYRAAETVFAEEMPTLRQVYVADVDARAAHAAAARWRWGRWTTDWAAVTGAPEVQAVDIVAPNHLHAEIAIAAMREGKAVLCEKPLADHAAAAYEMYRAAREAGVVHQVGFVLRRWPAIAFAKSLVEEGRIGRILQFRASYLLDYALDRRHPATWRLQSATAGAGAIADLGSHLIDLGRFLVGEISAVMARTRTIYPSRPGADDSAVPVDVDDATELLVEFDNGATGAMEMCWMAAGHKLDISLELRGDEGSIAFTWRRNGELCLYRSPASAEVDGWTTIIIGPNHPGAEAFWPLAGMGMGFDSMFALQARDFVTSVADGKQVTPSFLDGLRASEVIDASLRSAEANSTWVEVNHHQA